MTVRLWQVNTGNCLKILSGHTDGVHSVAFTPDGLKLASGGSDNKVRLWNVETGQPLAELPGHQEWVWSVAFSPDGKILASGSSDLTVKLWDVERAGMPQNAVGASPLDSLGRLQPGWPNSGQQQRGADGAALGCADGRAAQPA